MASKFADKIYTAILSTDADQPYATVAIDAELAEVREAMGHLLQVVKGANLPTCAACKRARVLYERLEVK